MIDNLPSWLIAPTRQYPLHWDWAMRMASDAHPDYAEWMLEMVAEDYRATAQVVLAEKPEWLMGA